MMGWTIAGVCIGFAALLLGGWQWFVGRHDRRERAEARKARAVEVAKEAAAARRALLRPVIPPGWRDPRVLELHNDGGHAAEIISLTTEVVNGSMICTTPALAEALLVGPGQHIEHELHTMGEGPGSLTLRWNDGRLGTLERTWDIDLPPRTPPFGYLPSRPGRPR